ncbi:DNA polymerase IV [Steroidobacter agaridevorans]|uniref:DNA polymerase IV n=1 Tax=Steroidobacter agaridevorans TaxID=2695856 RepID=A0A829Y518_9GAMM|nr:DNA polymerase IV [Steroidobacter agaridevorans]GFE78121.1 DNA polymerase IV [Steroidobacter agaridevorans]GFE91180.1 DNA polymerase IV [Steroidobacter agaridevorans]
MTRSILHVDMDAFYASVEMRDNPELRGKPVIVGGLGGRGVVAAASYEVRKYGVHSAMPMREALKRCPHAVCVKPRFEQYKSVSNAVFEIFHRFTPLVQGLSLDEAFLDVTHSQAALGSAESIAKQIKQLILQQTQLTASVGVAPNKLVAKIASDLRKPDGLVVVPQEQVTAILDPLPIRRLHGLGNKTAPLLERIGIVTLRDLRLAPDATLRSVFGKYTSQMKARAAGEDDRPVIPDYDEKQISSETTFDKDIVDPSQLHAVLAQLADRTAARLRAQGWLSERVTVKIRRHDFKTYTRQCAVRPATQETKPLAAAAANLLNEWIKAQPRTPVRLLGVGAGDLTAQPQLELFSAPESKKNKHLDAALDDIRAKFGNTAVSRASSLKSRDSH